MIIFHIILDMNLTILIRLTIFMRYNIIVSLLCLLFLFTIPNPAFSSQITYSVKDGDTLYKISKRFHVSVDTIKSLNNLTTNKLKIGQILVIKESTSTARPAEVRDEGVLDNNDEFIEYRVRKGDTLSKIAQKFNIDKDAIVEANNLKSKMVRPGKTLLIPKIEENEEEYITLPAQPLPPWKDNDEKYMLVKVAKSFMGAPYKYGGNSVRGLDCSAYVKKIYEIFNVDLPRSAREQFTVGVQVSKNELTIGDLVFFKTRRYAKYPTHVGIYIGDDNFIHSASGRGRVGVKIDTLSSDFYSRTYIGAVRVKKSSQEHSEGTSTTPEKNSNNS